MTAIDLQVLQRQCDKLISDDKTFHLHQRLETLSEQQRARWTLIATVISLVFACPVLVMGWALLLKGGWLTWVTASGSTLLVLSNEQLFHFWVSMIALTAGLVVGFSLARRVLIGWITRKDQVTTTDGAN